MTWAALAGAAAAAAGARLPMLLGAWLRAGGSPVAAPWALFAGSWGLHAATAARTAAVLLACWGAGRALRRALGLEARGALEAAAADLALGTAAWGQGFLLLGLAGLLSPPLLRSVLAAGLVWAAAEAVRRPPALAAARAELRDAGTPWLLLAGVQLCVVAPYAFVPETFFDALEYHLGLPHLYLLRGRIGPVPDNAFSGVPDLPAMLYGWTLALDPEGRAAHLLGFSFLPAAALALMGLGRRLETPRAGGLAAALFLAAPCAASAGQMTGVEPAWAFLLTAAAAAVLAAAARPDRAGPWVAAGLVAGAAMSCKTLAWAAPAALLALAWSAEGRPRAARAAACAAAAAAMLAPWLLRNAAHYGNPVYPFLHERFVPDAPVMPGWRYLGSGATVEWGKGAAEGLRQWLAAPWNMLFFRGNHADSGPAVLLGLAPAGLWAAAAAPRRPLLWLVVLTWLPLSLVSVLPRYFIPAFAPLALAAAWAVEREKSPLWLRPAVFTVLAASMLCSWRWALPLSRLAVFTGARSAEDFLSHSDDAYYPAPLYPAARWLGEHAAPGAKALLFGDARGFQVPRDHVLSTPMQTTVLERWAADAAAPDALRARFEAEGVTHVVINHGEVVRQRLEFRFTRASKANLDAFWRRDMRRVFSAGPDKRPMADGRVALDRWLVVYELAPAGAGGGEAPFDAYEVSAAPGRTAATPRPTRGATGRR